MPVVHKQRLGQLFLGVGVTLAFLLGSFLFKSAFDGFERSILQAQYLVRGEGRVDSSILVVYFGDDDIRSLGGLPLKRNYYALLVSALHDLGARVIGFDIVFSEPSAEYPEYDEVFSNVVRAADNVVLSGYFRKLGGTDSTLADTSVGRFSYSLPVHSQFMTGTRFVQPFSQLFHAASSIGHTNFTEDFLVPLFVKSGTGLVPTLAFELFRVGAGADRSSVRISPESVTLEVSEGKLSMPLDAEGIIRMNYVGGTQALHTIPALPLLQAYDLVKRGLATSSLTETVRRKIVLVGIIAEGRSTFVPTPFTSRFPAIGLHAVVLHNMLHGDYLTTIPLVVEVLITLVFGIFATYAAHSKKELYGLLLIFGLMFLYLASSLVLFSLLSWTLPLVRPVLVLLATTVSLVLFKHRSIRYTLAKLEREKENLAGQVREKETRLKLLEQELFAADHKLARDRSTALLEEIRKYKQEIQRLTAQVSDLQVYQPVVDSSPMLFEGIVYRSGSAMAYIVEFIKKIASNDAAVLVLGESGTGKELVAQAIHRRSDRKERSFIAVNCGALTETLLESELFGHEKGAFTGAIKEKAGRFELADGGTIFLDEVGETSEAFQVKLLRVLQEGEFERVGSTVTTKVHVRVIAASNKDLRKAVAEKQFREDLFYRLNVFTIQLPPLRDRQEDIPLLIEHFVSLEQAGMRWSTNVMEALCQNPWQGNVRELQSVIKRAAVLARSDQRDIIRMKDLPEEIVLAAQRTANIEEQILESIREKKFSHNAISETADELGGLNRGTVAEYFRGSCFKTFVEHQYDLAAAAESIAQTADSEVQRKVRKKMMEYLSNAVEFVRREETFEQVHTSSRPKFKNLPQRYHRYLEEILRSYHRSVWHLDRK